MRAGLDLSRSFQLETFSALQGLTARRCGVGIQWMWLDCASGEHHQPQWG
jgi:hypothetical protein